MWNVRVLTTNSEINEYFEKKEYVENFVRGLTYVTIKRIQILEYVYNEHKWHIRLDQSGEQFEGNFKPTLT